MTKEDGKIVYFVRHGQSVDNALPVFQSKESPLSELGRKQAEKIAHRISRISFEKLLSSPLARARETAEAISKTTGKEPEYFELFVERKKPFSLYGKRHEDEKAKKLDESWRESLYASGPRAEDGENFDDLIIRADEALNFLSNRKEEKIVLVTHGYFLRTMIARVIFGDLLTPAAFRNFQRRVLLENTGLSAIKLCNTRDGLVWKLWIYNDHTHLG